MENISLSIVTDNREYGRALGLAILSICPSFLISICCKKGYVTNGRPSDLILWDGEEARRAFGGKVILLSDEPSMTMEDLSKNRFCLYKYGTAEALVGGLFEIFSRLTGKRPINVKKANVRLFAFASCSGGSGCTTLAMAAGQELCRFHKRRVLYLSMEEIESTAEFISSDNAVKSLSQYLYQLFAKGGKVPFLESCLIKDDFGVEAFPPTKGRNPLLDMEREEMERFVAELIHSGRFDIIIIDVGVCMSEPANTLVELADSFCMVEPPTGGKSREEQYMSCLTSNHGEEVLNKVIRVKNMCGEEVLKQWPAKEAVDGTEKGQDGCSGKGDASDSGKAVQNRLCIGMQKVYMRDAGRKILLLEGDFGKKINFLARKMLEG